MLKNRLHRRPLQLWITQGQSSLVLYFSFPSHPLKHLFIILSLHYGPYYEVDGYLICAKVLLVETVAHQRTGFHFNMGPLAVGDFHQAVRLLSKNVIRPGQ